MWKWLFVFFVVANWGRAESKSPIEDDIITTAQSSHCPNLQFINKEMTSGGNKTVICPLGASVNLSCQINGPTDIHWSNPSDSDYGDQQSVILQDLTLDNNLIYTCASVPNGRCPQSIHFSYNLVVKDPSEFITERPNNTRKVVGEKAVFKCTAPREANITWLNPKNKKLETHEKGVLEIQNVGFEDEGWYSCVVQYSSECSWTEKAFLQVQTAEDFCSTTKDDTSDKTCEAAGKEFGLCEAFEEECDGECQCDGKGILS